MPRRHRRRPGPEPSPAAGGWVRREAGPDGGGWVVRSVSGSAATKDYRCPGCAQEIRAGVPHVVVWPAGDAGQPSSTDPPVGERRHWHTGCWRRGR